VVQALVKGKQ